MRYEQLQLSSLIHSFICYNSREDVHGKLVSLLIIILISELSWMIINYIQLNWKLV